MVVAGLAALQDQTKNLKLDAQELSEDVRRWSVGGNLSISGGSAEDKGGGAGGNAAGGGGDGEFSKAVTELTISFLARSQAKQRKAFELKSEGMAEELTNSLTTSLTASLTTSITASVTHTLTSSHALEVAALQQSLSLAHSQRRKAFNELVEFRGNIRVLCRVRVTADLLSSPSLVGGEASSSSISGGGGGGGSSGAAGSVFVNPMTQSIKVTHPRTDEARAWAFPVVFPLDSNQAEVFAEVEPLVQSALDGYHSTIFAYGQTGTGKTHTMLGATSGGAGGRGGEDESGVQPRALKLMLDQCFPRKATATASSRKAAAAATAAAGGGRGAQPQAEVEGEFKRSLRLSIMEIYLDKVGHCVYVCGKGGGA